MSHENKYYSKNNKANAHVMKKSDVMKQSKKKRADVAKVCYKIKQKKNTTLFAYLRINAKLDEIIMNKLYKKKSIMNKSSIYLNKNAKQKLKLKLIF